MSTPYRPYPESDTTEQRMMQEVLELLAEEPGEDAKDKPQTESDANAGEDCDGSGCDNSNCQNCGGDTHGENEGGRNPGAMVDESERTRGDGGEGKDEGMDTDDPPSQPMVAQPSESGSPMQPPMFMPFPAFSARPFITAPHVPIVTVPIYYQPPHGQASGPTWSHPTSALGPLPRGLTTASVAPPLPVAPLRTTAPPLSAAIVAPAANTTALSLGVRGLSDDQFDDLKRRLRMQVTSRRYRRRKKDEHRNQRLHVQQLEAELAHLPSIELHASARSTAAMQAELAVREQEVKMLSEQLRRAAREELEWVQKHVPMD